MIVCVRLISVGWQEVLKCTQAAGRRKGDDKIAIRNGLNALMIVNDIIRSFGNECSCSCVRVCVCAKLFYLRSTVSYPLNDASIKVYNSLIPSTIHTKRGVFSPIVPASS